MLGDKEPTNNNFPAPEDAVPIPTWVIVAVPAEHVPKVMFATGTAVVTPAAVAHVQPPVVRATAIRAYPVYVVSLVFCSEAGASVGSAVCRLR